MSNDNNQLRALKRQLANRLSDMNRLRRPLWVFDIESKRVCWGNSSCLELWDAESLEDLMSRDMGADMTDTVEKRLRQYQTDFKQDRNKQFQEVWTLYPNAVPCTVDVVFSAMGMADGQMLLFCEADAREALDAEALRSAEALFHTSVMITLFSASGEPLYRNPAARSSVRSVDETLAEHFASPTTMQQLTLATEDEINLVAQTHTADGPCWCDISARRCLDAVSGEHAWLISEVDVSRLKATEERAQFLAEHDTLTNLPNRNHVSIAFQRRIDQLLVANERGALIYIDIDRFKDINDTLGHTVGDQLLVRISRRLKAILRKGDSVARLGGDEFLLMIGPIDDHQALLDIVQRIKSVITARIDLKGRPITVTPSIGISLFPENGRNVDELMRNADLAMYDAKDSGRNDYSFFTQALSDAVESRINLETELNVALKEGQFITYFQPRVDVETNAITGAEALVRWQHPTRGMVSPTVFIPVCEKSGLISKLGKQVFAESVRAQRDWALKGYDLRVSVNLSPLQFSEESMVQDLLDIVEFENGNISAIELEITESVLLGHDAATIDKLNALVDKGFRIAIDDFGTGYSNLAYLHRYPLRCLKIDRSFIQSLDNATPIVELIVSMAKLFKLDVVAEGVETQDQLDALKQFKCHEYQGFLFEKPIDRAAFSQLLSRHRIKRCA